GMVTVSARDQATGKEQHVTIQPSSGLSDDEVDRLRHEADEHADEDRAKRESAELRNTAESMAYTAEKTLKDNQDKVDDELKTRVEAAVKDVRDALEADEGDELTAATEELSQAMQEIGQAVYGGGGAGPDGVDGAAEAEPDGAAEEEGEAASTVEGEFREV
ncbi:MAG: Hsp70 family protein, partial [Dehalococcoidia bacterium]|nr:Hsp70 family protein [Dehalococcoidia bacterium]